MDASGHRQGEIRRFSIPQKSSQDGRNPRLSSPGVLRFESDRYAANQATPASSVSSNLALSAASALRASMITRSRSPATYFISFI